MDNDDDDYGGGLVVAVQLAGGGGSGRGDEGENGGFQNVMATRPLFLTDL